MSDLIKISELARKAALPPSTIRHYTDRGLIKPTGETDGGQRLYDPENSIKRIKLVKALSKRGHNLEAIKEEIDKRSRHIKVLIVDDEPEVGEFVKDIFTMHNENPANPRKFEFTIATDGFTAGRMCGDILPDIVLLDLMLPGINGFEVCKAIKSDPDISFAKIIAITAFNTQEHMRMIFDAGADEFLPKPFQSAELMSKIEKLI
ncbi:response regulator [Elusimicrobiota bacterium]